MKQGGTAALFGRFGNGTSRYLAGVLLAALVNCSVAFTWSVPRVISPETASSWAVDTIAPVPPLTEAYNLFTRSGTDDVVYPLFHFVVLVCAYGPYVVAQFFTGGLRHPSGEFPYGVSDPEAFFGDLTLIANGVSLVMALGIVATLFAIGKLLFAPRAGLWTAAFAALLAPLGYYGKTANLDVPYLFWTVLAVWQCLLAMRDRRVKHYAWLGVFMALAVATKDQAYGFFVCAPLVLALASARRTPNGAIEWDSALAALVGKPMLVAGVVAAGVFALANNLLLGGFAGFVRHLDFLRSLYEYWSVVEPERRTLGAQPRLLGESVRLILEMFGPLTSLLCVAGIIAAARCRQWLALALPLLALGYYVSVVGVAGVVYSRYMLGIGLLLLPFAGAALHYALDAGRAARVGALAVGCLALGWQLVLVANLNAGLLLDSRYSVEAWIRANVPAGATIESQIQQRYLPRLADRYELELVGNSLDIITYDVLPTELTPAALAERRPDYLLVEQGLGVTGDPGTMRGEALQGFYSDLLAGRLGYRIVADFRTPGFLPYRQVTSGTHPRSIVLARDDLAAIHGGLR